MPHLDEYKWILDFVVFLYQDKNHAMAGETSGGTGFNVSVPTERWPAKYAHWHCVTNWHVAVSGGCPVIRVNTKSGPPHIIEHDVSDWIFLPGKYDVVVSPPHVFDQSIHRVRAIDIGGLVTEQDERDHDLNAAEDVFMVGRFVDYEGV
jgi:hypothetical protein